MDEERCSPEASDETNSGETQFFRGELSSKLKQNFSGPPRPLMEQYFALEVSRRGGGVLRSKPGLLNLARRSPQGGRRVMQHQSGLTHGIGRKFYT